MSDTEYEDRYLSSSRSINAAGHRVGKPFATKDGTRTCPVKGLERNDDAVFVALGSIPSREGPRTRQKSRMRAEGSSREERIA